MSNRRVQVLFFFFFNWAHLRCIHHHHHHHYHRHQAQLWPQSLTHYLNFKYLNEFLV